MHFQLTFGDLVHGLCVLSLRQTLRCVAKSNTARTVVVVGAIFFVNFIAITETKVMPAERMFPLENVLARCASINRPCISIIPQGMMLRDDRFGCVRPFVRSFPRSLPNPIAFFFSSGVSHPFSSRPQHACHDLLYERFLTDNVLFT